MLITDLTSEQLLLLVIPALPNLWALHHAMYHDFASPKEKSRWMMACVFLPLLGGIAYYAVGRKHALGRVDPFTAKSRSGNAAPEPVRDGCGKLSSGMPVTEEKSLSTAPLLDRAPDAWSFGSPDEPSRKKEE